MLRLFLRLVSPVTNPPQVIASAVKIDSESRFRSPDSKACHRDRLLSMRLEHTRLCSHHRCELLHDLGIITAGDLLSFDTARMQQENIPLKAAQIIRRYRGAIRLSAAVPDMMPRDAQLLISVHRRSVRGLACETPSALHRDLVRFSLSSKGRRLVRGRRLPSVRRIRKWIDVCETTVANSRCLPRAGDAGSIILAKAA